MIPDYFELIRYQDKRVIPFFYLILFIVLGFYWKNSAYSLSYHDAGLLSVMLAITLFNLIYDLKAHWVYSCKLERFEMDCFYGKTCSKTEVFLSKPIVASTLSILLFGAMIYGCLLLPNIIYSVICLFLLAPLLVYLLYRCARASYIKQILNAIPSGVKYKNLYYYVSPYVALSLIVSVLLISPLKNSADFSLADGFLSAKLMVAMLILCSIALAINLIFLIMPKKYIFFGRLYANEIDLFFSNSLPFSSLYEKSLFVRLLLLLVIESGWIVFVSMILALLNWTVAFEGYFLICFLPCIGYYFLQTYWYWHNEFLTACDMCFRYEIFKKYPRNAKLNR